MGEESSVEGAVDQVMALLDGAGVIPATVIEEEARWKCRRERQRICTSQDPHGLVGGIVCGWTYDQ